jgi:hypothetical protein
VGRRSIVLPWHSANVLRLSAASAVGAADGVVFMTSHDRYDVHGALPDEDVWPIGRACLTVAMLSAFLERTSSVYAGPPSSWSRTQCCKAQRSAPGAGIHKASSGLDEGVQHVRGAGALSPTVELLMAARAPMFSAPGLPHRSDLRMGPVSAPFFPPPPPTPTTRSAASSVTTTMGPSCIS